MTVSGTAEFGAEVPVLDPRRAAVPWYASRVAPLLNDPRDAPFIGLIAECMVFAAGGVALFFSGPWLAYLWPVYWIALGLGILDRFTLMLHCTSHRPLFQPRYRALNHVIPWMLGPFFGQTPGTYFAHHMGMHHAEENLAPDLSSTLGYQRDSLLDWLRYVGRFLTTGVIDLARYMGQRGRDRLRRSIVIGEGVYWILVACLFVARPAATFVVLLFPLVLIRTLMMIGNWGQHAFVAEDHPENPYLASITCINTRYNRRCFNDGYHIGHHLHARFHWTEYPDEFERNVAEYGRQDAIVFEGVDFFAVWLLLMRGDYARLARAYVKLPGAPSRSEAEIIDLLKARVLRIPGS